MKISPESPMAASLISEAKNLLYAEQSRTLTFAALKRKFDPINTADLALKVELLCDKSVGILKKEFYYDDDNGRVFLISHPYVKHYFLTGELYHPETKNMISDISDEKIIIEFLVLSWKN